MREEGEEGYDDMRAPIFYAKEMLEEEKEQLIQAVYRGEEGESFYGSAGDLEGFINARQDAEEWFERTYESD